MEERGSVLGSTPESMRRLEGIVASAMDGIITVDDAQRIILFNPAAERMFGLSAAEALGLHISHFMPERHREGHAAHIQRFAETGVTNRQMGSLGAISGLDADGREFPIEASISQVQVGAERLSTVILRDITERVAADTALEESRRRMEGIVESVMDGLITVDERQIIMLFNPAAERMFGVPAEEAIGAHISRFIPERFRAGHSKHIALFKQTGVTTRRMGALGAISGLRGNGEEFPIEASISQVEVGGRTLATVILRDITERRANEEARLMLSREVDHRAKNALAVVQALVSLTRADTKEAFVAAVRGRVAALGRAHSLLALNRWAGGDLATIVADETAAYHRGGQIQLRGESVLLNANTVQPLSLLIHELATNAVKYGALSVEHGHVEVSWRIDEDQALELSWCERGGPVVTAPAARGFGSTLVNEVSTRQLGGRLDIKWPPEGLRMRVKIPITVWRPQSILPLGDPAAPNGASQQGPKVESPSGGRILVVEDDTLIALELCADLVQMGWEVIGPAGSMEEANTLLDANSATPPDAAVLDLNLNGILAYPLAERLQARGVPVVFCTGYEQLDRPERYLGCAVIRKPVNFTLLANELRRLSLAA